MTGKKITLFVLCGSLLFSQIISAGAADMSVTAEDPENYAEEYPEYFSYNLGGLVFSVPGYYELVTYEDFDRFILKDAEGYVLGTIEWSYWPSDMSDSDYEIVSQDVYNYFVRPLEEEGAEVLYYMPVDAAGHPGVYAEYVYFNGQDNMYYVRYEFNNEDTGSKIGLWFYQYASLEDNTLWEDMRTMIADVTEADPEADPEDTPEEISGEEEYVVQNFYTKEQNQELYNIRQTAYQEEIEEMEERVPLYVAMYEADPYAESLSSMLGSTEEIYEDLKQKNPDFAGQVSDIIGQNHGEAAGLASEIYLADNEIGQAVREVTEILAIGALDFMLNYQPEKAEPTALYPIRANRNYAFVRSYGTIGEIIGNLGTEMDITVKALEKLREEVDEQLNNGVNNEISITWRSDFSTSNQEMVDQVFEIDKELEVWRGKSDALNEELEAARKAQTDTAARFYEDMGMENAPDDDYIYYLIDRDENVLYSFLSPLKYVGYLTDTGYVSVFGEEDGWGFYNDMSGDHIVLDPEGNIIYRNAKELDEMVYEDDLPPGTVFYGNPAPCGNILKYVVEKDFENGSYFSIEVEKPDGESVKICNVKMDGYGDFSLYNEKGEKIDRSDKLFLTMIPDILGIFYEEPKTGEEKKIIVDMSDGSVIDYDAYMSAAAEETKPRPENLSSEARTFGDHYYYKGVIYDDAGNEVMSLDGGGGMSAVYYDENEDYIWVVSKEGYVYALDHDLNQVFEPYDTGEYSPRCLLDPGYGMLIKTYDHDSGNEVIQLMNKEGEITFSRTGTKMEDNYDNTFIIGDEETGWYNIGTGREVTLKYHTNPVELDID